MQMKTKTLLVSLMAIATVLAIVASVSAASFNVQDVKVDGESVTGSSVINVNEGDTISVKVIFSSDVNAEDVEVSAEIDADKDVEESTVPFNVDADSRVSKTLHLVVPKIDKDELSEDLDLTVKIEGENAEDGSDPADWENTLTLRVKRADYSIAIKSINVPQTAKAGTMLPVDVVLKDVGYNNLDDLYVTASIPALGAENTAYFGDLVAIECDNDEDTIDVASGSIERACNEDDQDSYSGRIYVQVPSDAAEGTYAVEVEASNEDASSTASKQVVIENEFADVIATATGKTVAAGEEAEFSLLIVNPTNDLMVYRIVPEASGDLSVSASETVVAVPAGSSNTVKVMASSDAEGTYNFNVNVFSGEELVKTVTLGATVEGKSVANPVTVLTVILAIVFIVLLIVLFVLVGKKPEKSEEFGESYY